MLTLQASETLSVLQNRSVAHLKEQLEEQHTIRKGCLKFSEVKKDMD
jgi:hypothetical protein